MREMSEDMVPMGLAKPLEIKQLARSMEIAGVLVSARCYLVTGPRMRYEFVLEGRGECGIVDIPAEKEDQLREMMERYAFLFAHSVRMREGSFLL